MDVIGPDGQPPSLTEFDVLLHKHAHAHTHTHIPRSHGSISRWEDR